MNRNQISQTTLHSEVKALSQIQLLPGHLYQGEGFIPYAWMPRVMEELSLEVGQEKVLGVHWSAKTWMDQGLSPEYRLKIHLKGVLPLQCQNCLEVFQEAFDFEAQFLILATEEEVEAYPLDDDLEDVLAQDSQFNLFDLMEGEVLLSIPFMPAHPMGKCKKNDNLDVKIQKKSLNSSNNDENATKVEKPNPFEVLKKLKNNK